MHISDYTKYFNTPDELVDFLMLDIEQQNAILKSLAESGKMKAEMVCMIPQKQELAHLPISMPTCNQPFRPAS